MSQSRQVTIQVQIPTDQYTQANTPQGAENLVRKMIQGQDQWPKNPTLYTIEASEELTEQAA